MKKHNPRNERIKHRYFTYLRQARGHSEVTVNAVAKSLDRFEKRTKRRDFSAFHHQQAIAFKRHLGEQVNQRTGSPLSLSTQRATLGHLRQFHIWLADQSGFRSKIKYSDAEYFNLSEKDNRIATTRSDPKGPTIDQVNHVLRQMPISTAIELRNQALIALTALTGARNNALATFKLKHIDMATLRVFQDARDVKTKNSKTFPTWFFPVGDEILAIFSAWVGYLRTELLWGDDDPLFPATLVKRGQSGLYAAVGLKREHWATTSPIRKIFRRSFESAELPYFHPHSFRNTLVRHGMSLCHSPEEFKAWSQNLGHDGVMTTFSSYGDVALSRQEQIIRDLAAPRQTTKEADAFAEAVMLKLRDDPNFRAAMGR